MDDNIAKTVENLRGNPWVSLSFMDIENLEGYRLSGPVELIEDGKAFTDLFGQFDKKLVRFTADRMIEGLHSVKRYQHFGLENKGDFSC